MRLGRRKFLKIGLVGSVLVGAAGATAWFNRDRIRKLQPEELANYLRSNFDYLKFNFDQEQFVAYANDYREHYHVIPRESWYVLRGGDADKHARFMEHFSMTFLMSTDFFMHGTDESRPINYVMLYHPYRSPCWNPIAVSAKSA